jgi:AraC-like DNA-binding protein
MTYYYQQILSLERINYPHSDLTDKIIRAKRYIDANYPANIGLDEMAREAHLSKFHFIRTFTKYYGRTPHIYLRDIRLSHAKKLLQKGIPIRNVCQAVGFDSVPSFTRLFKSMTGWTPKSAILDKKISG